MKNKKGILVVMIVLVIAVLSCFVIYKVLKPESVLEPEPTTPVERDIEGDVDISRIPADSIEIQIYTINPDDNKELMPRTVITYQEEITPELITESVADSLEDAYYYVEVLNVIFESHNIIVDFAGDKPPCFGIEEDVEMTILDAFAQSLVDNVENCSRVIFRTDGSYYKSDNRIYKSDYIHLGI